MKYLIIMSLILTTYIKCHAKATYVDEAGNVLSKGAAIIMLAKNPSTKVYSRSQVYLSDKGTLKTVKAGK